MSNLRDTKCGRCGCWRKTEDFISNERVVKSCVKCRDIEKKYADKNRDKKKQYRIENRDKILEKQNHIENRDKRLEKQKHWRTNNPEYFKQYNEINRDKKKQYRIENRDKISENQKQWHIDNPKYSKQYNEEQKQNNPLQWKFIYMINHSKEYDKKHNLTITEDYITMDYLNELFIKQNGLCFYQDCECVLDYETFDKKKRNDNLITIQRHNNDICHNQSNTCFACFSCNVNKHKERQQFTQLLEASEQITL